LAWDAVTNSPANSLAQALQDGRVGTFQPSPTHWQRARLLPSTTIVWPIVWQKAIKCQTSTIVWPIVLRLSVLRLSVLLLPLSDRLVRLSGVKAGCVRANRIACGGGCRRGIPAHSRKPFSIPLPADLFLFLSERIPAQRGFQSRALLLSSSQLVSQRAIINRRESVGGVKGVGGVTAASLAPRGLQGASGGL
jgi:hypothetical protein